MTSMKLVKIADLVGTEIPRQSTNDPGNVGREIEAILSSAGFPINQGPGPDLFDTEIKTRKIGSKSYHTICRLSQSTIINCDYDTSPVKPKCLKQLRVKHRANITDGQNNVISSTLFDFSHPKIQELFRNGYENLRKQIINGCDHKFINQDHTIGAIGLGIFEYNDKTKLYSYRLTDSEMRGVEHQSTFYTNRLFEVDE